ncbi:MAG: hypothetical protein WDA65_04005 [Christensenellales bacterium]
MWVVVGMTGTKKTAHAMQKTLEAEGILVKLRNVSAKTKISGDTYEVLVLASEGGEAREILIEQGY